jgi:hypothetical protein
MSGTAAVMDLDSAAMAPLMPVSEPMELTKDVFLYHMTAMKAHYKSSNSHSGTGPTHAYALPVHLMFATDSAPSLSTEGLAAAPSPGKAKVDAALQASKRGTNVFAQHQTNAVNTATKKLQSTHNTSDFAAQMNAQRQKAKEESDKQIDATFNQLIDIGTQHPDQQQNILSLTQKIGAFFTNMLVQIGKFFTDIYNKIVGWIKSAADWVKGAAAAVGDWLGKTGRAIENFFGGLF